MEKRSNFSFPGDSSETPFEEEVPSNIRRGSPSKRGRGDRSRGRGRGGYDNQDSHYYTQHSAGGRGRMKDYTP